MAKKNNNQVSAVRQAKHGWIWTLAFTVISILWICLLYTSDAADEL